MTLRTDLIAARALVERGWAQHTAARRADGSTCSSLDPDAAYWCATGAVWASTGGMTVPELEAVMSALPRSIFSGSSLADWNDAPGRTQAEVLAAFDKAIEGAGE